MEGTIIVSGGDRVARMAADGTCVGEAALPGAGALCACGEDVLCCGGGGELWRLDARTLMPRALFAGGPGVRDMRASACGRRIYVLCGDADSVLMLDGRGGFPLLLCRAGAGPMRMALAAEAGLLAVAGGESAEVILLRSDSLERLARLPMPGPVYDVALGGGALYALCLSERLTSLMVKIMPGGAARTWELEGMPGALAAWNGHLAAATEERLYSCREAPALLCHMAGGRARRLIPFDGALLAADAYTDSLLRIDHRGGVRRLCGDVQDVCIAGA